jgi:hypothetical protein
VLVSVQTGSRFCKVVVADADVILGESATLLSTALLSTALLRAVAELFRSGVVVSVPEQSRGPFWLEQSLLAVVLAVANILGVAAGISEVAATGR